MGNNCHKNQLSSFLVEHKFKKHQLSAPKKNQNQHKLATRTGNVYETNSFFGVRINEV